MSVLLPRRPLFFFWQTISEQAMIESIEFTNFKALRKTTLPLSPFTLLMGPNGSGKTTVLQALQLVANLASQNQGSQALEESQGGIWSRFQSVTAGNRNQAIEIRLRVRLESLFVINCTWLPNDRVRRETFRGDNGNPGDEARLAHQWLSRMRTYSLDATAMAQPVAVHGEPLNQFGHGLPAVLDDLKDNYPERWELLLGEMRRWLPEYDYIQFDKPQAGQKGIALRTKRGGHRIPAHELSQGTLIALAMLTLAYQPNPPSLVGLEEIDRGLHPRLLRHLQDALYRLSYPESCGESRPPIQVIATTHSPYLLDLYRDHPEEVVLAQKEGLEAQMERLSGIEHFNDILGDSPLSDVWYSGVLGGVSVKP
jgi:predicted ATPase